MTLEPVIQELGLKTTPEELSKAIVASAPLDTVLIKLTVTDIDPQRASDIANSVADQFSLTVSELELHGIGVDSPVKVSTVKRATPAGAPSSPKKSINYALGLLLGMGLGIGLASLRKLLDNTVKNEDDLDGTPLLAAIGFDNMADEKPLITQVGRYAHPQVISFTSALPGEGKSTSAINLALSLAQAGAKTVLVETDLRRPKIPIYLEMSAMDPGITELISGQKQLTPASLKSILQTDQKTGLKVLLSGKVPPNPSELLGSHKFDQVLEMLRKQFEYVIIDCPPLLPVTDAAIVATKSDGTVLVIHAGITKRPHFIGARDAINSVGSHVLGVVLNKIPETALEYEYGYRYGYPKYYGSHYKPYATKGEFNNYAPSADEISRMDLDEKFEHIKGQKFKEELKRQDRNKN
jgi:non-specific protein-tyrosine kinase